MGWVRGYLRKLGVADLGQPSAAGLRALHRAQTERVAYENIDIVLGRPPGIDPAESIERILRGRGGYCFNLNGAFATLLEALGYQVRWHIGAVHAAGSDPLPDEYRNHLALTVELAGEAWMVDAGLGNALHEPMPLRPGEHRQGPFAFGLGPLPYARDGWRFSHDPALNSRFGMDFILGRAHWTDFAAKHEELSTNPGSPFVRLCQVRRRDERGADGLVGCTLHRAEGPGQWSERELATQADWFGAAADIFGLRLDDLTADDRQVIWRRVRAAHQAWLAERDGAATGSAAAGS
ncbi:MAG: arylamine N-acetyltransferase [Actinobacteria bacterium]|nr:arylamine N-acetyltransferase [Actinomycetota bacterium]MBO0834817.1 arylamine N-acetyltransferase [Actinomycetota bacterium]